MGIGDADSVRPARPADRAPKRSEPTDRQPEESVQEGIGAAEKGLVYKWTDKDETAHALQFPPGGTELTSVDAQGRRITREHSADGVFTTQREGGWASTYSCNSDGRIVTSVTTPGCKRITVRVEPDAYAMISRGEAHPDDPVDAETEFFGIKLPYPLGTQVPELPPGLGCEVHQGSDGERLAVTLPLPGGVTSQFTLEPETGSVSVTAEDQDRRYVSLKDAPGPNLSSPFLRPVR